MEQKIIDYIKDTYSPEAILLGGSRAKGREQEVSDWDVFLLGSQKGKAGSALSDGELLDVVFKNWPEENKSLTISSGPLWPVKVLFDGSDGKLSPLLERTKEDFEKGPMVLYKDRVQEKFEKMKSFQRKIEKYQDDPMVEFFYAGVFYEFALRAWFEQQNKWSLSPAEAIPHIKLVHFRSFY